jgi:hypothetical protein
MEGFSLKDTIEIVQALATVCAIVVGGIWAYMLFVKHRQKYPRATLHHEIHHTPLTSEKTLLHVDAILLNVGEVLLDLESAETRIQQIVPLEDGIRRDIETKQDPVPKDKSELDWPLIALREWKWSAGQCELEPGESEALHSEFVLDYMVKTVQMYTHIANQSKKRREMGWDCTTIYNLYFAESERKEK